MQALFSEFLHFLFCGYASVPPSRTLRGLSASCSKFNLKVCRIWRAEFFCGRLKIFCRAFIIEVQSKIGSCKEVFRTRAATITRLARQSVSDEDLKHFLLWQHRAIAPARFGGSFPPILRFDEKSLAESARRIAWCCLISGR